MSFVSLNANFDFLANRLSRNSGEVSRSVSRLSSGERITRAADDVANLSVSTRIFTRTTALRATLSNLASAGSLLQVAEGALAEIDGILQRMSQLSVMANSGGVNKSERGFLNIEFQNLRTEIDRIASETSFNGVKVLQGTGVLDALEDNTLRNTFNGTERNDIINGTADNDLIVSGQGNDVIRAGDGNDDIQAGTGREDIDAGAGNDRITINSPVITAETDNPPVTGNLVLHIDAATTGNIGGHPGTVATINDRSAFNNDASADTGAVISGTDTFGGLNSLSFDGGSFLQVGDTNDINLVAQNGRTILVAFQTGADVNTRQVIYEQGGTVNGFNFYIDGGRLYNAAYKSNGADFEFQTSIEIEANSSYVAGFIFDFGGTNSFRTYLNGQVFADNTLTQNQNPHSGDIGIGGVNNDTRFFDGSYSGDGFGFQGEIGELLNYQTALTEPEVLEVQEYLLERWRIGGNNDSIEGGAGLDTLSAQGGPFTFRLDEDTLINGIETIELSGNNNEHLVVIEDAYFTLGSGVENQLLTVDATGNTTGFTVEATELTGDNLVRVLTGEGNDTIRGGGNGNVQVSYDNSNAVVEIDLQAGTVHGYGEDRLDNVTNIVGSRGRDTIDDSRRNDTISGNDGDDVIRGIERTTGQLVTNGLVSYLDASDTTGITGHPGTVVSVTDSSGTGNTILADTGNVTSGGDIGGRNALTFDGNSWLGINDSADINTSNEDERSIFLTFKTTDNILGRQVLYEQGGGTNGYNIYIEGGRLFVGAWRNNGADFNLFLSTEIQANTAYTGGFVFDAATNNVFKGFLDGEEFGALSNAQGQLSHSGDIGIGGVNNASFFANGGAFGGDGFGFEGDIGEVLVYANALTDDEASSLQGHLINKRLNNASHDVLSGDGGNDTITGGIGNDTIDGGTGQDTAIYSGRRRDYEIFTVNDKTYVRDRRGTGYDGNDVLTNIETIKFGDGSILRLASPLAEEGTIVYQVEQTSADLLQVVLPNASTENLFYGRDPDILSQESASDAYIIIKQAIDAVTSLRADIGSRQASVDVLFDVNSKALQTQTAAHAALADTDITSASTSYANQLVKSSLIVSIAAQANNLQGETVLAILDDAIAVEPTSA